MKTIHQNFMTPKGLSLRLPTGSLSLNRHQAAINIYTDASVHQDWKSAWAYFVERVRWNPCGRLPGHIQVTLAELHAIHATLTWQEAQDRQDTIIHSDSMAAIIILAQTKTRTYPEITTKIINSAFTLSQRGSLTTLHWVPSHINIEENEWADTNTW